MQFFYSLIFNILTCISLIKEIDSHVHKKTFHGAETFDEFRQNILDYQSAISKATAEELSDEAWVTRAISAVGLYSEGDRKSAADSSRHIYGDDAIFQNKMLNTGLWQIPRQLAGYLIKLAFLGKQIESFVDVGTCRGATITVVTIYLQRFGLKWVETVDVLEYVDVSLQTLWKMMNLPITYHVTSTVLFPFMRTNYTAVFIDYTSRLYIRISRCEILFKYNQS